jgi:hypothetical protein
MDGLKIESRNAFYPNVPKWTINYFYSSSLTYESKHDFKNFDLYLCNSLHLVMGREGTKKKMKEVVK